MNKIQTIVITGLVAAVSATGAFAANPQDGSASAVAVTPLNVSEDTGMNYGSFAVGSAGGTVVLDTGDAVSASGDVDLLAATGAASADFSITGQASSNISVTVGVAGAELQDGSGNSMALGTFTNSGLPAALDGSGNASFIVGAALTVGASQTSGTYSTATGGTPYTLTVSDN